MIASQLEQDWPRLSVLLAGLASVEGGPDPCVHGLALDHRRVAPGDVFLACAGQRFHGGRFAEAAVAAGAVAVLWEPTDTPGAALAGLAAKVPVIPVPGLTQQIGHLADRFYGHPSHRLHVTGITGTNGKTSCAHFLAQAFGADAPCGVIGTLGAGLYGQLAPSERTTPDALTCQHLLAEMVARGARHAVMEVSSHGLLQGRVNGIAFDVAVFTNLTRDHLDYHGDMQEYGEAKRRLFQLPGLRHAVINTDDAFGRALLETLPAGVQPIGYGLEAHAGQVVGATALRLDDRGLSLKVQSPWGEGPLRCGLLGRFNASNVLAVLAVLLVSGMPFDAALQRAAALRPVPGRMERFGGGHRPLVVVDYAHTPDALEQALVTLREHCTGRLWCVFGCGGDRDAGKRPLMGAVAERLADHLVLTDDNPRSESGWDIIEQIQAGLQAPDAAYVVRDRGAAIAKALANATAGDIVLVAGKGHESYQQVGARRLPFSDVEAVRELLGEKGR